MDNKGHFKGYWLISALYGKFGEKYFIVVKNNKEIQKKGENSINSKWITISGVYKCIR